MHAAIVVRFMFVAQSNRSQQMLRPDTLVFCNFA